LGAYNRWLSICLLLPLYILTKFLIPFLSEKTGQEPVLFWFIVGSLGVFTPLIIAGFFILRAEAFVVNRSTWSERLRFRKISWNNLKWYFAGLAIVAILSGLLMMVLSQLIGDFDHSPPFMSFEPLSAGRCWLLFVWAPYWFLNIMGEEFSWRGVMLPRQEVSFGKHAWIIHGFGWRIFHVAFGWQLMLTLMPLIFVQSYIVQRTKNSWVGVIMHGGLNGPSFIAITLGLL